MTTGIIWHQSDLRIEWNPAVAKAIEENKQIVPIFIHSDHSLGEASLWWLFESLQSLKRQYQDRGSDLHFYQGSPSKIFEHILKQIPSPKIYWNLDFTPFGCATQESIKALLTNHGIDFDISNGNHLINPSTHISSPKKPYSIFTPFYKAALKEIHIPSKLNLPHNLPGLNLPSEPLLTFKPHWSKKFHSYWEPGREGAQKKLQKFLKGPVDLYAHDRDFPSISGTSKLSPHLHFGEISPFEIWKKVHEPFQRQLLWREFGTYFAFHFPKARSKNWNQKFDRFSWDDAPDLLEKWKRGITGYPIIDAGMRELWETGWMHNRIRMIVASFLIKDLFIPWQEGEKWFWNTLVDADTGNNALGWQWVAGSGPDGAPYFRIFNPILQSQKFDPDGNYIRRWVPELTDLGSSCIHEPWKAPQEELSRAGITLGTTYPFPIVDHTLARKEALGRFEKTK